MTSARICRASSSQTLVKRNPPRCSARFAADPARRPSSPRPAHRHAIEGDARIRIGARDEADPSQEVVRVEPAHADEAVAVALEPARRGASTVAPSWSPGTRGRSCRPGAGVAVAERGVEMPLPAAIETPSAPTEAPHAGSSQPWSTPSRPRSREISCWCLRTTRARGRRAGRRRRIPRRLRRQRPRGRRASAWPAG